MRREERVSDGATPSPFDRLVPVQKRSSVSRPADEDVQVVRSGENVRDLLRLPELFRERYPGFSSYGGRQIAAGMALSQLEDSRL